MGPRGGLHYAFRHEFGDSRFRDADMATDMNKPDTALRDEPPGETLGRA
jgi:hypothetical protein